MLKFETCDYIEKRFRINYRDSIHYGKVWMDDRGFDYEFEGLVIEPEDKETVEAELQKELTSGCCEDKELDLL